MCQPYIESTTVLSDISCIISIKHPNVGLASLAQLVNLHYVWYYCSWSPPGPSSALATLGMLQAVHLEFISGRTTCNVLEDDFRLPEEEVVKKRVIDILLNIRLINIKAQNQDKKKLLTDWYNSWSTRVDTAVDLLSFRLRLTEVLQFLAFCTLNCRMMFSEYAACPNQTVLAFRSWTTFTPRK